MSIDATVKQKILWAAIEDFAGLWELLWELSSSCQEVPAKKRRLVAERIVRELLDDGSIELYERFAPEDQATQVPSNRRDQLLRVDANWVEPLAGSVMVMIGATQQGEASYRTSALDRS